MWHKYIKLIPELVLYLGLLFSGDLVSNLKAFNDNDINHVHNWVAWYFIAAVWLFAVGILIYRDLSISLQPKVRIRMPRAILLSSGFLVGLVGMVIGCKIFIPLGFLFFLLGWFGFGRLHYPVISMDASDIRKESRVGRVVSQIVSKNTDAVSLLLNFSPLIIGVAVLLIIMLCGGIVQIDKQWLFAISYLEFILFAYIFGLTRYGNLSQKPIFRPTTRIAYIIMFVFGFVFLIPFMLGILATAQTTLLDQTGSVVAFLNTGQNDLIDQIAICATGSMIAALLSGFMIYLPRAIVYLPFEKPPPIYSFVGTLFLIYFIRIFFGKLHPFSFFDWLF